MPKRTRQQNPDAHQGIVPSIPRSFGPTLNMSPFICGFQDNMTSWMNSLINQQDGRLQTVARVRCPAGTKTRTAIIMVPRKLRGVTNPPVTSPPFTSARPPVDSQQETGKDGRTKEKGGEGRGVCGSVDHLALP